MRHLTRSVSPSLLLQREKGTLPKRMNTGFMDGHYDATVSGHIGSHESITLLPCETRRNRPRSHHPSFYTTLHMHFDEHDYFYFYFHVDVTTLPEF